MPSPPSSSPSSAQSALLRLSRRHSLPTSGLFSGFFAAQQQQQQQQHNNPLAINSNTNEHARSNSSGGVVGGGGGAGAGGGGGGNRHGYGHRHTLSQPIIVKNYDPAATARASAPEEVVDMEAELPAISDFAWGGILKSAAVEPRVNAALDAVTELCERYQDSVRAQVDALTTTQTRLQARMREADKLAGSVLKVTKGRTEKLNAEKKGLKGADATAEAAEATHTLMGSIVNTLLAIDEMLPPQDRLSPETSAHRHHFPKLHTLLAAKAAELNVAFGSGRSNGKRPNTTDNPSTSAAATAQRQLPLRRRLSSSSQILLSGGGSGGLGERSRAPPPQLQLKTILPSSPDSISPKVADSAKGAYFPLAPQTATGISLTHSNGKGSSPGPRPSPGSLVFFPIDEGEASSPPHELQPQRQQHPSTHFSWRRSSGSWSTLGGLFGSGRAGSRDSADAADRAQDRLKKVLESLEAKGKGKVKRAAAPGSSW